MSNDLIFERADDLIEELQVQLKKCKGNKQSNKTSKKEKAACRCEKCKKTMHLIDDLEFLGTIDESCLADMTALPIIPPLYYTPTQLFDMETPLTLPDMTIIPFIDLVRENALLYRFLEYRKLDFPHFTLSHYFESAPYLNKASIREEKLPVMQLLLGLDEYLMTTGETLQAELQRKQTQ